MEQFRTKIKHILPFLLALVILISCIPPIQASAASSLTLATQVKILSGWEADVLHGDLRPFSISVDAYVYKNGSIVDIVEIFLDAVEPGILGVTLANGGGQDRLWSSDGDHVADGGIIFFRSTLTITDDFACAFFSTYSQSNVLSRLSIDGQVVHEHYSPWSSQSIVDENGTTFECSLCDWELCWTPSGSGVFSGFVNQFGRSFFGQVNFDMNATLFLTSVYTEPDPDPEPEPEPDPDPVTYTTYSKVTQNLADWTGTYIIVYEASSTQGYVFTGVDEKFNSVLLPVDSGKIVVSSDLAVCPVRIEPYGTGYSIRLLSGANIDKFIYAGTGTSNKISFISSPKQLTISQVGTISYILDGEVPFQFNKTSSYMWFRFFGSKPGGQSEIALYKLDDGSGGGSSPDPSYKLIIDEHEEHSHTYAWGCQTEVEPTGTVFHCSCGWNLIWYATGNGTFSGFKDQNGNTYFGQCQFDVDGELRLTSIYDQSTPDPGTTYSSTITIDGVKYTFTSTTEQPAVSLQVTTAGAILIYNGQTQIFTYAGDGDFLGFSFGPLYDPVFIPGNSYPLAAGNATLFSVNDGTSSGVSAYETTIIIDGSVYQFFSEESYPLVSCFLSSEGVQLVCGEENYWWRPAYNQEFLGICLRPNSSEPDYSLADEYFLVRGSSEEVAFQFYSFCVESEDSSWSLIFRRSAEIFLIPVAVFFTFEFLPGISIGSVMIISLVLGILFFFLKSSK